MRYSKNFSRRPRIVAASSAGGKKIVAVAFDRGNTVCGFKQPILKMILDMK